VNPESDPNCRRGICLVCIASFETFNDLKQHVQKHLDKNENSINQPGSTDTLYSAILLFFGFKQSLTDVVRLLFLPNIKKVNGILSDMQKLELTAMSSNMSVDDPVPSSQNPVIGNIQVKRDASSSPTPAEQEADSGRKRTRLTSPDHGDDNRLAQLPSVVSVPNTSGIGSSWRTGVIVPTTGGPSNPTEEPISGNLEPELDLQLEANDPTVDPRDESEEFDVSEFLR
jgi:hypothetical protein